MNGIDRRLRTLLQERADRAEVAPDAWTRLEERLEDTTAWSRARPATLRLAGGLAATSVLVLAVIAAWDAMHPDPQPDIAPVIDADVEQQAPTGGWARLEATAPPPADTAELMVNDALVTDDEVIIVADGGNLWHSPDGARSFGRPDEALFALEDGIADLHAVTRTTDGILVAGSTSTRGGLWHTSDGLTFRRVEMPATGPLHDVLAARGTVVAVGHDADGPAAYVAREGQGWRKAEVTAPGEASSHVLHALSHGQGGWVAAGRTADGDGGVSLWHSASALDWQEATPAGLRQSEDRITAIAPYRAGFYALRDDGTVLASADGRTWRATSGDEYVAQDPAEAADGTRPESSMRFEGFTKVQDGWLVVGGEAGADRPPLAFASPDALRWHREPIDDHGDVQAMTVHRDGTVLAVGRDDACRGLTECPEHPYDLVLWRDLTEGPRHLQEGPAGP